MSISIPFVGKRNKDASPSRAERKPKVIPSISLLAQVRRVDDQTLEDYSGGRFAVWSVLGCDSTNAAVINGWTLLLNSIEYPLQVLIRQHAPDLSGVRRKLIDLRPEHMRSGRINDVANSLLDYLSSMESNGGIVGRAWYVIAKEEKAMEVASLLAQSGFGAKRLEDPELGLLLQACVSGMGYGHSQDFYQVQESGSFLELNHRYMSVYEVAKWPRRISLLFLEQLLRNGDEMDISMWLWPATQRESHSRLQMQRSRFEGSRIVSMQKGKLVPQEVEIAIADVTRISEAVERGTSKLFRRSMTVAVYGRTQDDLKAAEERLSSHFRASLAKINPLKFRQGRGFTALMPQLRPGVGPSDLTDTETLRRMFPFGPQDMNEHDGTLLGMDLRSRTPIIHNPFNPRAMNGHMVVMARSGAGKSFFTKLRVVRESQMGIPTYLIDPEGEYGVITRALGGVVFVPGSPGHGLNPFMVGYTGDEGDLTNRISSLCSLVGVMLEGEVNTHRKAIIDRCLSGFYASELRNLEGNGGVLARGGIRDLYHYIESDEAEPFGGKELAHLLSSFVTGTARFLMEDSAHDLLENEAPVTSFNLKNLSGSLKPVATSICSEVVWSMAVSAPRPRRLVVDECWTVLATPSGADALITIVKRARKYQLGLLTITQDVQDFLAEQTGAGAIQSHAGRSLLQNSAMKLVLSQDPAALPQVVDALGLSQDEGFFLAGSLRGQGLLISETGTSFPIDIVSTQLERELVEDQAWRQDGLLLPTPEAELEQDASQIGDAELLLERLQRERESDEVLVS